MRLRAWLAGTFAPAIVSVIWSAHAVIAACPTGWTCDCLVQTPYVPSGAGWAAVNNPSFENGSTGGVGNNWIAGYQQFTSDPTYTVTTERAHAGSYSQKITMPQLTGGAAYKRAGVYQQMYVVPGQSYTLTARVYCELDSSEQYNGEKMVSIAGLDPYGDTSIGEGSVVWSSEDGTKNQWRTLSVSTTAVFEVMTVYVAGVLKVANTNTGRIWIDNITISGTVPTQQPSPPEGGWTDPDLAIPETTGGELITNGGFEGSWSSGLAASWTNYTISGNGYVKQSTRIGPIGGGKYDFSTPATVKDLNPRVALSSVVGDADYWANQSNMVDTVVIGRLVIDNQEQEISNPVTNGRAFADECKVEEGYHPRIDAWAGLNEPDWQGTTNWANALLWEKSFAERAHEIGLKTVALNMSVGSPGNIWKMLDGEDAMAVADYVGYHTYGGQVDQLMVNASNPQNDPCSFALRWRKYVDMYRDRGWRMPPAIYTEGTTYGGWHGVYTPAQIRDDLIAFGPYILEDRWAVGLALFCAGCNGVWEDWDIQGQGDIATACGTWNQNNPTEATDGLYSQQFGAGTLHPISTTELNNINGNFTGGVRQQISGLVSGKTYLLDLDFRYEFRGAQPQAKFYTGVDLTGQTSNPSAGTISWSPDIIVDEAVPHDQFERTWRTFVATGSTASIWLKGQQTVSNPAYRISVDRVSVRQVVDGSSTPAIALNPTSINVSTAAGSSPANGSFTVRNSGTGTLSYTISDNVSWLSCSPTSGSSTGEYDTITITYSTGSLSAGSYNATITVSDPNAGNNPQTIPVALTVQSCSNGSLTNAGFETGTISPWTTFGDTDGVLSNGFYSINANTGTKMFGAGIGGATQNGGAYQQVAVCSGASCSASSYIYTKQAGGANWDVNCRLGIDPTGGTNSTSGNIVWTGWTNSQNAWSQISLSGVTASATTVTVFLEHEHKWALSTNVTLFDDVTFSATGGGAPAPTITRSPATLTPSCNQGANASNQTFTVQNSGGGTLSYTITDNVSWLSCSPTSGTSTGEADTITVTYATSGLSAGVHNGTITITDPNATNNPQTIAVTLTVIAPPTITRSPATLTPSCVQGTNAANQTFTVQNTGGGTLSYTITDNVSWLSCSPTTGTSTGEVDTITVTYASSGLTAGTYNGTITITDPNATNNPQTIAVTLTVTGAPTITRAPATLTPSVTQGSNASNQTFTIQNTGGGTLSYTITDNVSWLSCSPTSGTSTGEVDTITVTYATTGLAVGTHNGTITITASGATNSPQTIAVTLTVNKKTVAENFTSLPSWSSSFDASWGNAASWSVVGGGQSGNALQATRSGTGSSAKVKVFNISPNTSYTIKCYMKCPSSSSSYWRECFYKLGSYTAQDFDQNGGTWTEVKKFSNTGTNGNGNTWVQYTKTFNSGSSTQISVGFKTGNSSGTAPTMQWDTLRVE